jgi:hypothetical protein
MPQGIKTLSSLRSRLELMLSLPSGDSYVGSTPELDDINEAYQATVDAYNWPSLLARTGIVKVANVDRYTLPINFNKARTVRLDGIILKEVELEFLQRSRRAYTIDEVQNDILVTPVPSSASTTFTLTNTPAASDTASLIVASTAGIATLDEIYVKSVAGTSEFTLASAVAATTVTARLKYAKSAGDTFYREKDIIDMLYYQTITLLSAAGDVTLLPPTIDYIMLFKAAALAYGRLEMWVESGQADNMWKEQLSDAWLAADKPSTGENAHFSI